ncbi:MAG: uracil-xanthine permease [Bacteroidaceae bacterium]|nr:uracil-xanthine permease [Bacteroidaceae bacterium]MBR3633970.1 uracil-xanthine permease [Bacteroidaceae bacterium]
MTNHNAIYDAQILGKPRMALLGLQHMFAMFGATVLVPLITGLSVSTTLLFAGVGTLIFHFIAKWKVPAFLGSSFAFLGGYAAVTQMGMEDYGLSKTLALDYAGIGICAAAVIYFVVAALIKAFGLKRVIRFFPPVVVGPMIIAIGLCLSGSAISNCTTNWAIASSAVVVVIAASIWGRGLIKIIPILLGVIVSYVVAACLGEVDFSQLDNVDWVGLPIARESTVLAVFDNPDYTLIISSIVAIMPLAIATVMEHIGDISAISSTVNKDYLAEPGLHRTLTGDGVATFVAAFFGAPANTTYGENTGVLNITRVFDPRVIRLAAMFAIVLAFCPKFAMLIQLMPAATIGGISLILYGMIAAVGVRNMVEAKVDLTKPRNLIVAALILVISIGVTYGAQGGVAIGPIHLSGLAIAAMVGVILNAIFPREKETVN